MNKIEIPSVDNVEEALKLFLAFPHDNGYNLKIKASGPVQIKSMHNLIFNDGETIVVLR